MWFGGCRGWAAQHRRRHLPSATMRSSTHPADSRASASPSQHSSIVWHNMSTPCAREVKHGYIAHVVWKETHMFFTRNQRDNVSLPLLFLTFDDKAKVTTLIQQKQLNGVSVISMIRSDRKQVISNYPTEKSNGEKAIMTMIRQNQSLLSASVLCWIVREGRVAPTHISTLLQLLHEVEVGWVRPLCSQYAGGYRFDQNGNRFLQRKRARKQSQQKLEWKRYFGLGDTRGNQAPFGVHAFTPGRG